MVTSTPLGLVEQGPLDSAMGRSDDLLAGGKDAPVRWPAISRCRRAPLSRGALAMLVELIAGGQELSTHPLVVVQDLIPV